MCDDINKLTAVIICNSNQIWLILLKDRNRFYTQKWFSTFQEMG